MQGPRVHMWPHTKDTPFKKTSLDEIILDNLWKTFDRKKPFFSETQYIFDKNKVWF